MEITINQRIENLHKYYKKLINYLNTITNNQDDSEDIYSNMIVFLIENDNEKIYDKDSYNINYIYRILYSRAINRINYLNKNNYLQLNEESIEEIGEEYDIEKDELIEKRMDVLLSTIKEMQTTNFDRYINYYVKFYLYKTPIKLLSQMARVSPNTLYTHFRLIQSAVEERVKEISILIETETVK